MPTFRATYDSRIQLGLLYDSSEEHEALASFYPYMFGHERWRFVAHDKPLPVTVQAATPEEAVLQYLISTNVDDPRFELEQV